MLLYKLILLTGSGDLKEMEKQGVFSYQIHGFKNRNI